MDQDNRVIVLIDMDCFYCQVEEKLNPALKGKPIAVVQYNPWQGGGIIAVNYVARAKGVTRHMRGKEAKEKCPDIELPAVPCLRGKADISRYREAGKEVARVLQKFTALLERASIDEAYLDITASVSTSYSIHLKFPLQVGCLPFPSGDGLRIWSVTRVSEPTKGANFAGQQHCKEMEHQTNPSGQHSTVGQNLLSKERPMFSNGLLKAVDV